MSPTKDILDKLLTVATLNELQENWVELSKLVMPPKVYKDSYTRKEIEAEIVKGATELEVLEMLRGSLQYQYAVDIITREKYDSPQAREALRRHTALYDKIARYKEENGAVKNTLTRKDLENMSDRLEYEKLALHRMDAVFFMKLPGLEVHKEQKQRWIDSISRGY